MAGRFRRRHQRRSLHISVQPFFASELFVPRLAEFTSTHPDVDITVDTTDEALQKHPVAADVSIRLFRSPPAELGSERIFPLRLVAACAPELIERIGPGAGGPRKPFPLIVHGSRPEAWRRWVESSGLSIPTPQQETVTMKHLTNAPAHEPNRGALALGLAVVLTLVGLPLWAHPGPTAFELIAIKDSAYGRQVTGGRYEQAIQRSAAHIRCHATGLLLRGAGFFSSGRCFRVPAAARGPGGSRAQASPRTRRPGGGSRRRPGASK